MVAVSALAMAGLIFVWTKPAFAEFEIQESEVEKGEAELEYRGAVHWGFPKAEREEAEEDGDEEGALEEEEEGEFLRQSHDLEFQYEIVERKGNGLGLAFQGGYGFATRGGEADEIEFGPIIELASGNALLTINPLFGAQVGDNRETDGLGFEYGWRAQYNFAKKWAVGAEMFGEIEDLSNAGSFDDQNHSLGPTLFYMPGGGGDDDIGNGNGDDDDNNHKVARPAEMEFSMNVGVQFGLTDVTSDTALKFQGSLSF